MTTGVELISKQFVVNINLMSERPKAVREIIPRRWGIIPLGSKLGEPIQSSPEGQSPTRITIKGFIDREHQEYYATVVEVTGPGKIAVYEDGPCGPTGKPATYEKEAINHSPAKSKLRWA